ncbi:uncharacterized protein LOC132278886 [Cornus florida]|uniref:uncharacterized protein LOC132278886 n=1 Tax=Cornus florida TaxID=4283 RepID=UPI00289D7FED|nr:uncharacterized protein LOC132278886 [Cornus florida]
MAHLVKPLMQWPRWLHQYRSSSTFHHLLHSQPPSFITTTPSYSRNLHFRSRGGLRVPNAPPPSDLRDSDSDSDSNAKKSRNEKKREARRAVRWAMELASFSNSQIKRIIEVASLEEDLFDALVLVKTFGRDVREGKRRQYNYIGRLLRGVQPELMDSLIQATRDGDQSRLQALSGTETHAIKDDNDEALETEYEEEEEGSNNYVDTATRWFDGLIAKDIDITKEIYSLHSVEFDRQELRKLVRKVHSTQEHRVTCEENEGQVDAALEGAERALTRFLQAIAKSMPTE